jgi:RNA polymerase sigma-70 factor (ECF subfamily)
MGRRKKFERYGLFIRIYQPSVKLDFEASVGTPDEFIPTRQSLLCRLRDWNDQKSWQDFFETYWRLIYKTALQAGLTDSEAQDVVQETIVAVAKAMPGFRYDPCIGSFKTWLMNMTRWRITDQLRKRAVENQVIAHKRSDTAGTRELERVADPRGFDPATIWEDEWERNITDVAIEHVKRRINPKHYQLFDLYVFQHWPVHKITKALKVNRGWVYLVKHRVSALVRQEIKALKKQMA